MREDKDEEEKSILEDAEEEESPAEERSATKHFHMYAIYSAILKVDIYL